MFPCLPVHRVGPFDVPLSDAFFSLHTGTKRQLSSEWEPASHRLSTGYLGQTLMNQGPEWRGEIGDEGRDSWASRAFKSRGRWLHRGGCRSRDAQDSHLPNQGCPDIVYCLRIRIGQAPEARKPGKSNRQHVLQPAPPLFLPPPSPSSSCLETYTRHLCGLANDELQQHDWSVDLVPAHNLSRYAKPCIRVCIV